MLKKEKVRTCDILVFHDTGILGKFDHSYGHVAVVSQVDPDGKIHIIEAHLSTKDDAGVNQSGILEKTLSPKFYKVIEVMRYFEDIDQISRQIFIEKCRKSLVGKVRYGLERCPQLWIYSNILRPLGLGNLSGFHNKHSEVCSTWPQEYFEKWLGIDVIPELNDVMGTPSSYMNTKALVHIC